MHTDSELDVRETARFRFATIEIVVGLFLMFVAFLQVVLSIFGWGLVLKGVTELLPLLVGWLGCGLTISGQLLRKFHMYPVVTQIPVIGWLIVFFATFA